MTALPWGAVVVDTVFYHTKVSLPLRSSDRAAQCPEVDRCQLKVIENPRGDQITIEDGPVDYRKLVRIGMQATGRGCDYLVRVGLVGAGGICARGFEKWRTTETKVSRTNTVSGQHIETTTTTTRELVDIETPTGEETTTSSTQEGFDTLTTVITVTVSENPWEKLLDPCAEPQELFLPASPRHMINARHQYRGVTATLITYQDMSEDGIWHVIVARSGDKVRAEKLHLTYTPSTDDLRVSAALSPNLLSLYIVESRRPQAIVEPTAHWYTFSPASGEWSEFASGAVPDHGGVGSSRHRFVTSAGQVVGYWAPGTVAARTESYTNPDGGCGFSASGEDWEKTWYTNDVDGAVFDMSSASYLPGVYRISGPVGRAGGLITSLKEETYSGERLVEESKYQWGVSYPGGTTQHTRSETVEIDYELSYSASIGNVDLPVTRDEGLKRWSSGSSVQTSSTITERFPPYYYDTHVELLINYHRHHYTDGHSGLIVGQGGWVTHNAMFEVRTADLTGSFTEYDTYANNVTLPCPAFGAALEGTEVVSQTYINDLVYPVSLGQVYVVRRSFTTVDSQTRSFWTGVEYKPEESDDYRWRIFKNGSEVTTQVANCIARPMEQFCGIFWRV